MGRRVDLATAMGGAGSHPWGSPRNLQALGPDPLV